MRVIELYISQATSVLEPGYEGIRARVRGYYIRGTRVFDECIRVRHQRRYHDDTNAVIRTILTPLS